MKTLNILLGASALVFVVNIFAEPIATLREGMEIDEQSKPGVIGQVINEDIKTKRNYPMQPPLIPHKIRGYEINLSVNKCMSCHSRKRTEDSQAPMVSVTHFMNQEGNFLAELSPRRYFCTQCHVPQVKGKPAVESDFEDMDDVIKNMSHDKK